MRLGRRVRRPDVVLVLGLRRRPLRVRARGLRGVGALNARACIVVAALLVAGCSDEPPAATTPEFVVCSDEAETEHAPCEGDGYVGTCFSGVCAGACTTFDLCPFWSCHERGCVEGFCRYRPYHDGVACAVDRVVGECRDAVCVVPTP